MYQLPHRYLSASHRFVFYVIIKTSEIIRKKKVNKGAKIRNRYNKAPHLTQDNNGKVTNSQFDTTNESQAGDHKAHINRRAQMHSKHKRKNINDPQKNDRLGTVSKIFYWRA